MTSFVTVNQSVPIILRVFNCLFFRRRHQQWPILWHPGTQQTTQVVRSMGKVVRLLLAKWTQKKSSLIVFANLLMIGAFHVNRRLRTRTNLLLMSLAVADMLIGSISMPLWVYIYITSAYNGSVHKMYVMFDVICGVSSILNLTAISLERYYALRSPIKHRNIRKSMPQSFSISTPFFFDKLIHPLFFSC